MRTCQRFHKVSPIKVVVAKTVEQHCHFGMGVAQSGASHNEALDKKGLGFLEILQL